MDKFGVDCPLKSKDIKEKIKQTCLDKFGVDNVSKSEDIKEKIRETNMKNFGVPHPMQNPLIVEKQQKSAFKRKMYTFPSGRVEYIQGYEPFCLDDLLHKENVNETDIVCDIKLVPRIDYMYNDKQHKYFPDIHIPSQNKLIEIKSAWTYSIDPILIQKKKRACELMGFNVEIRVYDNKGRYIIS